MSRRDIKKSQRRDESGISTRIVFTYPLQSMNREDDWFILEYTSHSLPFCHNLLKSGENCVMVLQPGLAATSPSISTVMSSQHWSHSQWLNMQDTTSLLHTIT